MSRSAAVGAIQALGYATNHICSRIPSYTVRRAWYRRLGVQIGPGSQIHLDCHLWFNGPGQIARSGSKIGLNTHINRGCLLDLRGSLEIGSNVSISPEVAILTADHDWRAPDFAFRRRSVVVEDFAWLGTRAVILPGSRIGRGAVVAAGSVVNGTIPPLALASGVPAQIVGHRPATALGYALDAAAPLFE